jgi:hypothetical protein
MVRWFNVALKYRVWFPIEAVTVVSHGCWEVRASGMWSCTVKFNEENPTYAAAGLAQENGFGSPWLCRLLWLVNGTATPCTCRKECTNMIYLLLIVSDWSIIIIAPRGLLWVVAQQLAGTIRSCPPISCPSFCFMGGVAKDYSTKLGCENYFRRVVYWVPLEMLLQP